MTGFKVLSAAHVPPFTIEDATDGGDELRMKYRYLDIRRRPVRENLLLRNEVNLAVRNYLHEQGFTEVETPYLIKSTPEGARDFVVPSRMNPGEFYALPQSPQTFKQLLMVGGMDKYYQIVKCFRDEDLRADRQPEFTQIDCEMSFVGQDDILNTFEGLTRHLLFNIIGIELDAFPRMSYDEAMRRYGNDKPDIRFGMEFVEFDAKLRGTEFKVFSEAEMVVGIKLEGGAERSRKQLDALRDFVQQPQLGMSGLIWSRHQADGSFTSSVNKFFDEQALKNWGSAFESQAGDLMLILAGAKDKTRSALSALRMHLANELGLRKADEFGHLFGWWIFPCSNGTRTASASCHAPPLHFAKEEDILARDRSRSGARQCL